MCFKSILLFTCVSTFLTLSSLAQETPNVILIMTDDQGYGEMGVHGNPLLKTPHMDRLHDQSLRLIDFHVSPMCTPTRGQLLSGMDATKNGAVNVSSGRSLLRKEIKTMANYFSDGGYQTGIFGKWHLGDNYPYRPEDRGFNETLWFPSSHIGSVPDYWGNDYFDDVYIHNGQRTPYKGYCTDVFFDRAMKWIDQCTKNKEPFFAYIPTNAPHQPFNALEQDIQRVEKRIADSEFSSLEPTLKHDLVRYLAMIENIDQNLGKLDVFLRKRRLTDNTILIFLTDNGSTFGPDYYNAGMRGKKTQLYEGGHRVPFFIRWPNGGISSPKDIEGLAEVQDILPTLAGLCHLDTTNNTFNGIDLSEVLKGNQQIDSNRFININYSRMPFYFDYPSPYSTSLITRDGAAVLWKKWRLLNNKELYNLSTDPLQQKNVFDAHPDVVKIMREELNKNWNEVKATVNNPQRIVIGTAKENPSLASACEWMDVFVDQQGQVEAGERKNSYWLLDVETAGTYELSLRRWPRESQLSITATSSPAARALPIAAARINIKTTNDIIQKRSVVNPADQEINFRVNLDAGPITLHTWFDDKKGEAICGAYYVYIRKLN